MRNRDRCGGSLRGERKGWTEGSKHRVPRARHGRGHKEGGLVPPASRPPGPGNRDHFTGEKKTLGQGLHFENFGASTNSSLEGQSDSHLHPGCPSSLSLQVYAPSRSGQAKEAASPISSQNHSAFSGAPWAHLGSLPEGALHSCYGLGHGVGVGVGLRTTQLVPLAARGQFPNQCMRSSWQVCLVRTGGQELFAERRLEAVPEEGSPSEA